MHLKYNKFKEVEVLYHNKKHFKRKYLFKKINNQMKRIILLKKEIHLI